MHGLYLFMDFEAEAWGVFIAVPRSSLRCSSPIQRGFFRLDERREKGADVEMARGDKVRAIAPSPEESPCLFFGFAPNLGMEPGSF